MHGSARHCGRSHVDVSCVERRQWTALRVALRCGLRRAVHCVRSRVDCVGLHCGGWHCQRGRPSRATSGLLWTNPVSRHAHALCALSHGAELCDHTGDTRYARNPALTCGAVRGTAPLPASTALRFGNDRGPTLDASAARALFACAPRVKGLARPRPVPACHGAR